MAEVLVTGATGLVGANVCQLAIQRGDHVRALVRPSSDTADLRAMGVELFEGDVTDRESVRRATKGSDLVVHSAAVIAGISNDIKLLEAVNVEGSRIVMEAAGEADARAILVSAHVIFDYSVTVTEHSALATNQPDTSYSVTKRFAYLDAMRRIEKGQDIVVVMPGAVYGPSPVVRRSLDRAGFNGRFLAAIRGEVKQWVRVFGIFVLVDDVARMILRAADVGKTGATYLAHGGEDSIRTIGGAQNVACELAGSKHRVLEVDAADIKPGTEQAYGGFTMVQLARSGSPTPLVDGSWTRSELDFEPTPFDEGMATTVDWYREIGELSR
jgi:dihydroflavonol-4-reductase